MSEANLEEKVTILEGRIAAIEKKIASSRTAKPSKRLLSTEEAAVFLGMTLSGLRRLTHKKLIPYYKPNGKNMYFDIDELSSWQKKNHFEPIYELEAVVQRSSK